MEVLEEREKVAKTKEEVELRENGLNEERERVEEIRKEK